MKPPSRFQRLVLPGLAFKAVVIGGGYATGRELVEFFLQVSPSSGLAGLFVTAAIWCLVCALTFAFARQTQAFDYQTFFKALIGPVAPVFEIAYCALLLLVLSAFGAAAGEIAKAFGIPALAGTATLAILIMLFTAFGNESVERVFKYVSVLLYATYAAFVIAALTKFGGAIGEQLSRPVEGNGWLTGASAYAAYNVVGAVAILPTLRHLRGRRDALIAGGIAGLLGILPAILFFVAISGSYPDVVGATLPSDFVLRRLDIPVLHVAFQIMVVGALLESGTGMVHALMERVARERPLEPRQRAALAAAILFVALVVATRVGLVEIIAQGYRWSAVLFLTIYVVPLITIGSWKLIRGHRRPL